MASGQSAFRRVFLWGFLAVIAFLFVRWQQMNRRQQELRRAIDLTIQQAEASESSSTAIVSARNKSRESIDGSEVSFVARSLVNGVEVQKVVGDFKRPIPPGETVTVPVSFKGTVDEVEVDFSPVAFFPGSDYFTRVYEPHRVFKGKESQ